MFCGCSTDFQTAPPNSHTCPICLGLPGTLPVANRRAVEHVLATGLAIAAEIVPVTRWDRKNYFYPDLPKGYQISQYDLPLTRDGRLTFDVPDGSGSRSVSVGIRRAHLEEDTARLIHTTDPTGRRVSLVDFNRSGVPLMEIVTEPDLRSAIEARRYAEELRLLLLTIGASDAAMESGQMRVEANVSLRPEGSEAFGTRVEVKNMNSFRSVERAIGYETERQAAVLDGGQSVVQETRGWDDDRGLTYSMRLKEESEDYRYFPEPDLPPLRADAAWLDELRGALPELPGARRARYRDAFGLSPYDATVIVGDLAATRLFEAVLDADGELPPKQVANWVTGEYLRLAKGASGEVAAAAVLPAELARLVRLVVDGELSGTNAKQVFERHATAGESVDAIVEDLGLTQISDESALTAAVEAVLAANPEAVADVRAGKGQAIGFLVGQVMKETRGQANAGLVQTLLRRRLGAADTET
jgi:aspartyl-tRNA(Asn)/glutamyl-tRNA(Gln) amidotransferase subunit B